MHLVGEQLFRSGGENGFILYMRGGAACGEHLPPSHRTRVLPIPRGSVEIELISSLWDNSRRGWSSRISVRRGDVLNGGREEGGREGATGGKC